MTNTQQSEPSVWKPESLQDPSSSAEWLVDFIMEKALLLADETDVSDAAIEARAQVEAIVTNMQQSAAHTLRARALTASPQAVAYVARLREANTNRDALNAVLQDLQADETLSDVDVFVITRDFTYRTEIFSRQHAYELIAQFALRERMFQRHSAEAQKHLQARSE